MIGVQSCKHFGCQRSQPTILGFRHPSGALEDGARGKFRSKVQFFSLGVFKQWNWTDYYVMWSLCIVESTVLARQTKKLSKFEVRDQFCQQYKMPGGTNFFRGTKFFYGPPYVESIYSRVKCESFSLLAGQTKKLSNFEVRDKFFQGPKIFLRAILWRVHI